MLWRIRIYDDSPKVVLLSDSCDQGYDIEYNLGEKMTYTLYVVANKGIISGYANGDLGEYDDISCAQCASILNRIKNAVENNLL